MQECACLNVRLDDEVDVAADGGLHGLQLSLTTGRRRSRLGLPLLLQRRLQAHGMRHPAEAVLDGALGTRRTDSPGTLVAA